MREIKYILEREAKILIANNTSNIAENIVFVRTFRPSTGAIVNAKDQHR